MSRTNRDTLLIFDQNTIILQCFTWNIAIKFGLRLLSCVFLWNALLLFEFAFVAKLSAQCFTWNVVPRARLLCFTWNNLCVLCRLRCFTWNNLYALCRLRCFTWNNLYALCRLRCFAWNIRSGAGVFASWYRNRVACWSARFVFLQNGGFSGRFYLFK